MLFSIFVFFSLCIVIMFIVTTTILFDISMERVRPPIYGGVQRKPTIALLSTWFASLAYIVWLLTLIKPQ